MTVAVTVIGAIIVAVIAAVTAQSRLRQQLDHDRELKDLDELRALLDECAQVTSRSAKAFQRYGWFVRPRELRDEGAESRHLPRTAAEALDTFGQESERLSELYQRVVLRLGEQHPVALALLEVQAALTAATLIGNPAAVPSDEAAELWGKSLALVRGAHFAFLERAQAMVGSRIR